MNPSKRKGDRAELEAADLINRLTNPHITVQRALGAGRAQDTGDIFGLPHTTVQVCNWANVAAAVRQKPLEAEQQRVNAGERHACTWIRLRGGAWRVTHTPEQWAALYQDAWQSW